MFTHRVNLLSALAAVTVTASAGLLSIGLATPALADGTSTSDAPGTGSTSTSFAVTGGSLTITAPAASVLTGTTSSLSAQKATGALGPVTVTDLRGETAGWTATAQSTAFTAVDSTLAALPATGVDYTTGTFTVATGSTYQGYTQKNISSAKTAAQTLSVTAPGDNLATWSPTIDVGVPANSALALYTGTITHSLT